MNLFTALPATAFALLTGLAFGFLLRKAAVSRFDTIIGQLLLRDFTVMKVILTAIVVGSIGIYSLSYLGMIPSLHLSKTPILFTVIGGAIFGIGMSLAGYCPGTAIAALADGAKDMLFGLLGMLAAALLFNRLFPLLAPYVEKQDAVFKETIASHFSLPNWAVVLGFTLLWVAFALAVKKFEQKQRSSLA